MANGGLNTNTLNSVTLNASSIPPGVIAQGAGALVDIEQRVIKIGSGSLLEIEQEIQLRITGSGSSINIEQSVATTASGSLVSISQWVRNSAIPDHYSRTGWEATLTIGGVIIDRDQIHGTFSVTREEESAAILRFTLIPDTGIQDLTFYQGKAVTLDVLTSAGNERIYTGVVDIPDIDIIGKRITFHCTDRRREQVNAQLPNVVKNIGFFSSKVFTDLEDTADELDKRLSTVPKSLDFDAYGNYHITDWAPKATADYTFADASVYYRDPEVEIARRGKIINKVNIAMQYRYSRLHQRTALYRWTSPIASAACLLIRDGYTLTPRIAVQEAANQTGWKTTPAGITYGAIPESGWYNCGQVGDPYVGWSTTVVRASTKAVTDESGSVRSDANGNTLTETNVSSSTNYADIYTTSASWSMTKRWTQVLEEAYTLTVTAPQSVSQYGAVEKDESFGVDDPYDSSAWDGNESTDASGTYAVNQDNDLGGFNTALVCIVNRARTSILKSHRQNLVKVYRSILPSIDLKHTVELSTVPIDAKGKVTRIEHILNINTGEAYTHFEITMYKAEGSSSDTTIAPPTRPTLSVSTNQPIVALGNHYGLNPSQDGAEKWNGMIGNAVVDGGRTVFQESFIVDTPAIEVGLTNQATLTKSKTYNVVIPNNTLTITF